MGDLIWCFYMVLSVDKQFDGVVFDSVFEQVGNVIWGDIGVWKIDGGGGIVWDLIIYDEVNDSVIFGVGNGLLWNQCFCDLFGFDNLFLFLIVVVDVDMGVYKWYFQIILGDNWDYIVIQILIIVELLFGIDGVD